MKKFIIGLVLAISSVSNTYAQKIVVVNATRQDWSGGVAGHYGTNYSITLSMDTNLIKLDSLYYNGQACPLYVNRPGGGNVTYIKASHNYTLSASEAHYERPDPLSQLNQDKEKAANSPMRKYDGAALITYYNKGRKQLLVVKQMQSLPPIAYP